MKIHGKTLDERTEQCTGEVLANPDLTAAIIRNHLGVCYEQYKKLTEQETPVGIQELLLSDEFMKKFAYAFATTDMPSPLEATDMSNVETTIPDDQSWRPIITTMDPP